MADMPALNEGLLEQKLDPDSFTNASMVYSTGFSLGVATYITSHSVIGSIILGCLVGAYSVMEIKYSLSQRFLAYLRRN
jgi:hypothetical protein